MWNSLNEREYRSAKQRDYNTIFFDSRTILMRGIVHA